MKRPCIDCSTPSDATRCPACARRDGNTRAARRGPRHVDSTEWQRVRRAVLTAWRAEHGNLCPGDAEHRAHETADLTVDHLVPQHLGGTDHPSNLRVVCRQANSRKGARG